MAKNCKNSSFYVPKTNDDLQNVMLTVNVDQLEQPVRIWTDYIRLNRTHLWSNTAKHWWNIFNQQDKENYTSILGRFKDSVTFNGHRKIMNFSPSKNGCCVCVVNLQLKWQFKSLILAFVASTVFVAAVISISKLL